MEKETAELFIKLAGLPDNTLIRYTKRFAHIPIIMPNLMKLVLCDNLEVRTKIKELLCIVFDVNLF